MESPEMSLIPTELKHSGFLNRMNIRFPSTQLLGYLLPFLLKEAAHA